MEPPITHIKKMGLHWVRYPHDSSVDGWQYLLMQWNPGSQTWTRYDEHDTGNAIAINDWEYFCAVPDRPDNPYQPNFAIDPENYKSQAAYQDALARQNMVLNALPEMTLQELEGIQFSVSRRIADKEKVK